MAVAGVLILSPDTLLMRWTGLDPWALVAWRGTLLSAGLLLLAMAFPTLFTPAAWRSLLHPAGLVVVVCFAGNGINFTMGVAQSSVTIVLTALATTPLLAALFSAILLKEKPAPTAWVTMLLCVAGFVLVVGDGGNALNIPTGSPLLGALFGFLTALGWAVIFVTVRRWPQRSLFPAAAVGAALSGAIGATLAPSLAVPPPNLPWVLLMGLLVLPVSFGLLTLAPRYLTAPAVSLIMLLEAVLGPLWVWWGTGEEPTWWMVAGATLVLGSLALYLVDLNRRVASV